MHELPELMALAIGALSITALARRFGVSEPLALVLAGLVASFVPGLPDYRLDPDVMLVLVLPPLLYSAALSSSYIGIRAHLRPIALLAVGLVLFTTVVVGVVAWWAVPGIPLSAAFVLGAVVAPPDAVAATAIGRRLGLPRRIMTVLNGESLVNDATALTAYRVAVAAVVGTGSSLLEGAGVFVLAAAGGLAIGAVAGWVVHRARMVLKDGTLESAVGLLVPYATYLVAEQAHASGVLAVVVAGLFLSHRSHQGSAATRVQDQAVWRAVTALLEAVVFALIGLQLRTVVEGVSQDLERLVVTGVALTVAAVLARAAWVLGLMYVPERLFGVREPPPLQHAVLVSWSGMRGVVSLTAAFAIPAVTVAGEPFPFREELVFLAFFVTLGTLLLHGLTLPWLIRRLRVTGDEHEGDALVQAQALHDAARVGLERLEVLLAKTQPPEEVTEHLRRAARRRSHQAWERLGRGADELGESPSAAYRRLRAEMLAAERAALVRMRDERRVDDEILRPLLHEIDLEELMLQHS